MASDLDILKDIPGYKAILKSVLKSQIQLLIEQLSDQTGEETIILTASIHDGTLSHLGSCTGKGFLDGRDEIKSQFLAFCLKSHHKKKTSEARSSPYQRPHSGQTDRITPSQGLAHKRPRLQPVSLQRAGTGESPGNSFTPPDMHRAPSQTALSTNGQDSTSVNVKLESSEQSVSSTESTNFVTTSVSLPTSIQLSHTQTSAEPGISDTSEVQNEDDFTEQGSENEDSAATSIKIEPITENEMELEITGVEPGKNSVAADSWSQVPGTSGVGDGSTNETGDQTGYKDKHHQFQPVQLIPYPPTSSREPVILFQAIADQDPALTTPTDVKVTPTHDLPSQASFTTMLTSFDYGSSQNTVASDVHQDTPTDLISHSKSSAFSQNIPKPSPSNFGQQKNPVFGPTPIPLSANERIVIPSCTDEQYLPFTKENYGKEKDKWVLKRHICQHCGKRCMKPSDLTRHIKIHTGEYPFECQTCKKRFRERFNLNAHFKKANCNP